MSAALIVGAGDATGGAIARAFAREGYTACVNRRARNVAQLETLVQSIQDEGFTAKAYPGDARLEEDVTAMVDAIERDVGPIEVAVFDVGANVNFSILETTAQVYRKVWEMAAFAGFLMGREVAKRMVVRGRGSFMFPGRPLLCVVARATPPFRAPRVLCGCWRNPWRGNWGRRIFMSRMS